MVKPLKVKVGSVVVARWVVCPGPGKLALMTDTRCVVREVRKREARILVDREDGRSTSYWLDCSAVRLFGYADAEVTV